MSALQTIENIKLPYPTEGIIRTAQLDDTVAPENSVQLAVNMNFDRIGAVQTRLGVTTYATQLADPISNYGTLRNSIVQDGFNELFQIGLPEEVADPFDYSTTAKIDDEHVLLVWQGADDDGFAQVIETNLLTGGATPLGSPLEFASADNSWNKLIRINSTHYLNVWTGVDGDAFAQVLLVSLTTWAVTAIGSPLEFDTSSGEDFTLAQVDSNHFICFYEGPSSDGIATILEVNLSSFAVTEPGSPTTFVSGTNDWNSCFAYGNGTHFVNVWNGKAQAFSVNTGTWAITAIGSPLTFDAGGSIDNSAVPYSDGQHFINFWQGTGGGNARVFAVNPSTYAITAAAAATIFTVSGGNENSAVSMGDDEHFVNFWDGSGAEGFGQIFEVNPSTFAVTLVDTAVSLGDMTGARKIAALAMSTSRIFTVWIKSDDTGQGAMFKTVGDLVSDRWLYAGHDDEVSNWDEATWTVRRSSLATVSRPRFSQFLNYIWMVNGNESIGGDPVATSNGGAFGTDLVPEDFPPGDFIHAGFEGRVWVADKTLGVIYYTDIVQFTPPDIYSLSYDPDVNFITTISPQSGEQFTALQRVPRALLVFTENTITRIYGATSLDAYPAYNVGTYSQESIIETKTGIFFHHSSGFYQFDYGSQPVEISRRVIDFVKAIPRSYYEDITGVYDGFDAVEWSVGQVTVEGVVFSNCVMRYTISTQVWTIYDYTGNTITAMISYDNGTALNHLMGTFAGKTGAMDVGLTDFSQPFYFEYIDRWRAFGEMYYQTKNIGGLSVYSENAAGANFMYQVQKSGPNAWETIGTINENNNSQFPTTDVGDFDVARLRIAGNTSGSPVVIHGIEIIELTIKGTDQN